MWATTRGGLSSPGQAVAGLPGEVAEQHVGLEVLLERLALEERGLEGVAERTDGIGEHVVEHAVRPDGSRPAAPGIVGYGCRPMSLVLVSARRADGVATPHPQQPRGAQHAHRADGRRDRRRDGRDRGRPVASARVVVTGAAPAFCAGANLGNLAEATEESLGNIYEGFLRIARSPLPTLAAVNGAAVGAGMNLALGCDVRIAARRAKFDTRFLQIGIHPGGGHTWMLRRIVGPQATFAGVVFGEVMDGAEAERVGLVHRCVDDDQLLAAAQRDGRPRRARTPRAGDRGQEDDPGHGRRRHPPRRRGARAHAPGVEHPPAVVRRAHRRAAGEDLLEEPGLHRAAQRHRGREAVKMLTLRVAKRRTVTRKLPDRVARSTVDSREATPVHSEIQRRYR